MKKVFVLGSLNIDMVMEVDRMPKIGETRMGDHFLINPGGKGANQAVAAAKCGADTTMFGAIGDDIFGKDLVNSLKKYNVNTEFLQKVKGPSGTAIIVVENTDNRTIFAKGANAFVDSRKVIQKLIKRASPGDILAAQLEIPQQVTLDVFETAKKIGMKTTLNPAPASKINSRLYQLIDFITPNETEAEILTGIYPKCEKDYINIAKFFDERGVPETIITLGKRGSVYINRGQITFIPAHSVNTVDTTAAGDSFIGGLCSSLAAGKSMIDAMKFSTAVSAITVTRRGAQNAIPLLYEVEEFIAEQADR